MPFDVFGSRPSSYSATVSYKVVTAGNLPNVDFSTTTTTMTTTPTPPTTSTTVSNMGNDEDDEISLKFRMLLNAIKIFLLVF